MSECVAVTSGGSKGVGMDTHPWLPVPGEEKPQLRSNQNPYRESLLGLVSSCSQKSAMLGEPISLGLPEILFKVSFSEKLHIVYYCLC